VHLTVREVKRLGAILDGAIGLGANQINGIGFEVSNPETNAPRADGALGRGRGGPSSPARAP